MKKILQLLPIILLVSCNTQTNRVPVVMNDTGTATGDHIKDLRELEDISIEKAKDTTGELISKILFNIKTDDLADFPDGKIPWMRIDSPQIVIKKLIEKDKIVITENKITVIIDYPLTNEYSFDLVSPTGFTRAQLIKEISTTYYKIYDEEEKTATIKTVPMNQRTMYNRNKTDGKYGIWGHDIGDLALVDILVYKSKDGTIFLRLEVDS